LHLVDIAPYDEKLDPVDEVKKIINELKKYDEVLFKKPRWLILNKIDLVDDIDQIKDRIIKELKWDAPIFTISAINGKGCKDLIRKIMKHIDAL
jgi:GTP-binding protein